MQYLLGRGIACWRVEEQMIQKQESRKIYLTALESGGYLLSHNIPQCSTIGDAVSLCCPRPSPLRCSPLSPSPARRRRAQPTPRMAHTAPHSATPPPMRHTRGGKRRLFLPGQKRYGLSQKRSKGLSFFSSDREEVFCSTDVIYRKQIIYNKKSEDDILSLLFLYRHEQGTSIFAFSFFVSLIGGC